MNPKYAVIQVGKGNKYGHPTQETLNKLKNKNIEVYRNDLNGNIVAVSDGNNITFNTKPSKVVKEQPKESNVATPPFAPDVPSTVIEEKVESTPEVSMGSYIGNKNSQIFHRPDCKTLPKESNRVYFNSKDEGINSGYRGCKKCNP